MTSLGPVPGALLSACHLEPASKVEGKPLEALDRGPILAQEASTDTMDTTSVPGITTLTPFGNLNTGATDFPADVELLPSDPVRAYQLSSAGIVGSMDTTGVVTPLPNNPPPSGQVWTDMAVDPTSGIVYASASTCSTISTLSTLNFLGGASALVGTVTNSACTVGIAFTNAGVLYGYDIVSDNLLRIDKFTGAGTIVGPIGFNANFGQAMDCDPASGICYLFAFNNTAGRAELRSVDLTTGASTLVGVIGAVSPGGAEAAGAVFGTIRVHAAVHTFTASLDGAHEVPANLSMGTGTCTVTLNDSSGQVSISGSYQGLQSSAIVAHLHGPAPAGMNAGVILALSQTGGTSGTISGSGTLTASQVQAMLDELTYINVHTTSNPGGEIRGQIPNAPAEASRAGDMMLTKGVATSVDLTYTPSCGATNHVAYWGLAGPGPIAPPLAWTDSACGLGVDGFASIDPGDPAASMFYYFIVAGQTATKEGSYGHASSGAERPEASGVGLCDLPQALDASCP